MVAQVAVVGPSAGRPAACSSLVSEVENHAPENYETAKSGIPNRKKIGRTTPLSCKIDYFLNADLLYLSAACGFFTDDKLQSHKGQQRVTPPSLEGNRDAAPSLLFKDLGRASSMPLRFAAPQNAPGTLWYAIPRPPQLYSCCLQKT